MGIPMTKKILTGSTASAVAANVQRREIMAEAERAIDIGHNQPPSPTDLLREELENSAATILRRRDELLAAMERVPTVIMDETVCGRVADFVKQVTGCYKLAENARTAAKEPHLSAGRIVDGFFKGITDPLEKIRRSLDQRLTVYQRAKADAERRAREAEAERQRIEAERLRREAEEAAAKLEAEADLPDAVAAEQAAEQAAADAAKAQQEAEAKA